MIENKPSVHYINYLDLDKILSSQNLLSGEGKDAAHDEMLFIIIHQTYELWFKQIIHEIDSVMGLLKKDKIDEENVGLIVSRITTTANSVAFTAKTTDTGGCTALRCFSAQTQVGSVTFNSGGTAFNTSSDYRRKENVIDLTGAIARLKTLLPKRFNFIDEPSVTRDGFLAHEITTVPEAVWGTKDAVEPEDNENTGAKKGDPIYQQLDQSKLVPLLTAALQEAITKIETLETKVAALEAA